MRCRSSGTKATNAKVNSATITKWLAEGLDKAQPAFVGNPNGDVKAAIAGAAKKVEAVYYYPYQNHAAMEPMNATALYTRTNAKSGAARRTAKRRSPPRSRRRDCPPTNARCTS